MTVNGAISVSGPVVLKVDDQLKYQGGSFVNTTLVASNLQIISSYGNDPGETKTGVTLSGGSTAYLTVYAPHTSIVVSGGGDLFGALIGSTVSFSGGSKAHFDEALGVPGSGLQAGLASYKLKPGSWSRCQSSCS